MAISAWLNQHPAHKLLEQRLVELANNNKSPLSFNDITSQIFRENYFAAPQNQTNWLKRINNGYSYIEKQLYKSNHKEDRTQNFEDSITSILIKKAHADTISKKTYSEYIKNIESQNENALKTIDPIIIDTSKLGYLTLEPLNGNSPTIDIGQSGTSNPTSWVTPTSGILVIKNSITGNWNILGSNSNSWAALLKLLPSGQPNLSATDPAYAQLGIWIDVNGNGIISDSDVHSLQDLGISSINLLSSSVSQPDPISGDIIEQQSTVTYSDGSTSLIASVELQQDPIDTTYQHPNIPADIACLPNLHGYGTLHDLQDAMVSNPDLKTAVQDFVSLPADSTFNSVILASAKIIFQWANVSQIPQGTLDEQNPLPYISAINAFLGTETSYNDSSTASPEGYAIAGLSNAWFDATTGIAARLLLQGPLSNLSTLFTYDLESDSIYPTNTLEDSLTALLNQYGPFSPDTEDQWKVLGLIINSYKNDYQIDALTIGEDISDILGPLAATYIISTQNNNDTAINPDGSINIERSTTYGGNEYYIGSGIKENIQIKDFSDNGPLSDNYAEIDDKISDSDLKITTSGSDLILSSTNGTQIILKNQLSNSSPGTGDHTVTLSTGETYTATTTPQYGLQDIVFANGTLWSSDSETANNSSTHHLAGLAPGMSYTPGGFATLIDSIGYQNTYNLTSTDTNLTIDTHGGSGTISLAPSMTITSVSDTTTGTNQIITINAQNATLTITSPITSTENKPISGIIMPDGTFQNLAFPNATSIQLSDGQIINGPPTSTDFTLANNSTIYANGPDSTFTIPNSQISSKIYINGSSTIIFPDGTTKTNLSKRQNADGSISITNTSSKSDLTIYNQNNQISVSGITGVTKLSDIPTIAQPGTFMTADISGAWIITPNSTTTDIYTAPNTSNTIDLSAFATTAMPVISASPESTYDIKLPSGWNSANTTLQAINGTTIVISNSQTQAKISLINALPNSQDVTSSSPLSSIKFHDESLFDTSNIETTQTQTGNSNISDTGFTKYETINVTGSNSIINGAQYDLTSSSFTPIHYLTVNINSEGIYNITSTNSIETDINLQENFGKVTYDPTSRNTTTVVTWANLNTSNAILTATADGTLNISYEENTLSFKNFYNTTDLAESGSYQIYSQSGSVLQPLQTGIPTITNYQDINGIINPSFMPNNDFILNTHTGTTYAPKNGQNSSYSLTSGTYTINTAPGHNDITQTADNAAITLNNNPADSTPITLNIPATSALGSMTATWNDETGHLILGYSDNPAETIDLASPMSFLGGTASPAIMFSDYATNTDLDTLIATTTGSHELTGKTQIGTTGKLNIFDVENGTTSISSAANNNIINDTQNTKTQTNISLSGGTNNQIIIDEKNSRHPLDREKRIGPQDHRYRHQSPYQP